MKICTFFGHRDSPLTLETKIYDVIQDLIEKHEVEIFYVGNQGQFDSMVRSALRKLKIKYPHIRWYVVLAYIPTKSDNMVPCQDETLLPEGIESVPRKFAISYRNRWMIQKSDYIVSYINRSIGGAAQFVKQGERMNKQIIHLGQPPHLR